MQVSIAVRDAVADDAANLAALLGELGYEVSPEQVVYELANEPDTTVLVALVEAVPVGLAAVTTRRTRRPARRPPHRRHPGDLGTERRRVTGTADAR